MLGHNESSIDTTHERPVAPAPADARGTSGRSVLVIDPDRLVQLAYNMLLRRVGFDVITTGDTSEAVAILMRQQPDTAVVNASALGHDMDELMYTIQANAAGTKVVMTAGGPNSGMDPKNAELAGMMVVAAIEAAKPVTFIRMDRAGVLGFSV